MKGIKVREIEKPATDIDILECLGVGYIGNTSFIIYKGKFTQNIYLKDNSKNHIKDGIN